jgi:hypothetical protein
MAAEIKAIGVHPVTGPEPVHLVELLIGDCQAPIDIGAITQEVPGEPQANWQVPYDEKIVDPAGQAIVADPFMSKVPPTTWHGDIRIAFFFHYLDLSRPLRTPLGPVPLPAPTPTPSRLPIMAYDPQD